MSGILGILVASGDSRPGIVPGTAFFSSGKGGDTYYTGYANSTGNPLTGAFGSMNNAVYNGATINGIYQTAAAPYSAGQVSFVLSGNRTSGFVNTLTVNGNSAGTISAPSYNSTYNQTTFTFGTTSTANLFTVGQLNLVVIT